MKIDFAPQAHKYLQKIERGQPADFDLIIGKINALAANPEPPGALLMRGGKGERRIRAGAYRVIYSIGDDTVTIVQIGKRNDGDVYRGWGRQT